LVIAPQRIGVVLCNIGGPSSAEVHVVQAYLRRFFSDPAILPARIPMRPTDGGAADVRSVSRALLWPLVRPMVVRGIARRRAPLSAQNYAQIGGRSPLLDWTDKQARALEKSLNERRDGREYRCAVAMRYAPPLTEQAIDALDRAGFRDLVVVPLYPQESCATTGSSLSEVDRIVEERNWDRSLNFLTKLGEVRDFHRHPTYVKALAERIEQGLARFGDASKAIVVFSAHGLPKRYIELGDPYQKQIEGTVEAVLARLSATPPAALRGAPLRWRLGYQSRVGPEKWLEPDSVKVVEELAAAGERELLLVPVAFVSDHIETMHEIGIEMRHLAESKGVRRFEFTEGLNDSPTFIQALQELTADAVDRAGLALSGA